MQAARRSQKSLCTNKSCGGKGKDGDGGQGQGGGQRGGATDKQLSKRPATKALVL